MPTAQNLLSDRRHHDRMIEVVVGRVAISDILKCDPGHEADYAWITWLKQSVGPFILALKLANKCIDNNLRGIEHRRYLRLGGGCCSQIWCAAGGPPAAFAPPAATLPLHRGA
jgi:hypothetical protein